MTSDAMGQTRPDITAARSPESIDELASLVEEVAQQGGSIRVVGGRTRQAFGNVGDDRAQRISTTRLNRVIEYSPVDLTIAVEPGCTISQINDLLAENGQALPLDVAHAATATIGGSFATGLSGPRRLKHGSLKDRVIGTEVINSSGVNTKSGGMVVKNVSGYELSRLHYGAHGAFGVVTRINLKVAPKPEAVTALMTSYQSFESALAAGTSMAGSQLEPDAVFVTMGDSECQLDVWFSGGRQLVENQVRRARSSIEATGGFASFEIVEAESGRIGSFESFVDLRSKNAVVRVSAPPSAQLPVAEALMRAGSRRVCADVGSGLVYALADPAPEWRDAVLRTIERPVFLALPDTLKRGIDVFGGAGEPEAALLRRLKQEYDPGSLFNPGRFVLGL